MKTNIFKLYILSFFILSDFLMFAQPGDDDTGGGLEEDDTPAAPVNGKIIWLMIAAIIYAVYTFNKKRIKA